MSNMFTIELYILMEIIAGEVKEKKIFPWFLWIQTKQTSIPRESIWRGASEEWAASSYFVTMPLKSMKLHTQNKILLRWQCWGG